MTRRSAKAAELLRAAIDAGDKGAERLARQIPRSEMRRLRNRAERRRRAADGEQPRGHLGWET